jgi:hypothetical protein
MERGREKRRKETGKNRKERKGKEVLSN